MVATKKLFLYGTLQPFEWNWSVLGDAIITCQTDCTTPGEVFWVYEDSGYPVAKFDPDSEHRVVGSLVTVLTDDPGYIRAHDMELGAGYEPRTIQVTTPDGQVIEAEAYHYRMEPRGKRILSGDWAKENAVQERARR